MKLDENSVALVTGANGGIGQAIARALRRAGARVIVSGRRADALAPIAAELGARVIVADLARREDVARLASEAGDVDVLVANAALPASGPLLEFTEEQIDRALDVNLRAPLMLARSLGERMVARRRGQIVFIASISGMVSTGGTVLYSATKFGMRGMSLALREDLAPSGVGVTTIFPGFIRDAGMFAESGVALPKTLGTRTPEDVATAVLRAVREDPDEIVVAAPEQRLAALVAGVSPALITAARALLGASAISAKLADAQRHKR